MSDGRAGQIAELEQQVREAGGVEDRARLAELYRRQGRLADAERTAREALARDPDSGSALAVLALAMLDGDRGTQARVELEERAAGALAAWSAARADARLSDAELERAFDAAEPQLDEMITPDRLAEEAALRVDGVGAGSADAGAPLEETADAGVGSADAGEDAVALADAGGGSDAGGSDAGRSGREPVQSEDLLGLGSAFSTRTMADLLEEQGDTRGAARIRAALGASPEPRGSADPGVQRNTRVVAALERWLENVRRHST